MKRFSILHWVLEALGVLALLSTVAYAQNASLQWNLMSDSAVTTVVGTVAGQSEKLSYSAATSDSAWCLYVKDYAASGGGQRLNLGAKSWPNQSAIDTGRYVQFAIHPTAGCSLQVSSISMTIGAGGTSNMRAAIYYSTNPMFNGSTVLVSSLTLPNGAWYDSTLTAFTASTTLNALQTLYVRVYPWYNSSNASTTKYVCLRNVKITGTTFSTSSAPTVVTASVSSITSSSAVCGGTVVSGGSDSVTVRGVCWNTRGTPTVVDQKTIDGAGIGIFTSTLAGLAKDTTYYVRAYATNSTGTSYGSEHTFVAVDPPPPLSAFPGAEGFGRYAVGGRGGRVIEVTSLEDATTEGTLRYAVNQSGPRTVVFRVSGTIKLNSPLTISNSYITIAGQTAPGDGITLRDYTVQVSADNVILRYLRFRMGDAAAYEGDALGGRDTKNVIIDHCSISWSTDECGSFYDNQLFTLQWCILTESLRISIHAKGTHGYGGIWGGQKVSFHHNLLAHHDSRNPRFCGSRYSNRADLELVDFRNNIIYNWGANSGYAGEGGRYNMVNNYYKPGPATKSGVKTRIFQPNADDGTNSQTAGVWGSFYVSGNVMAGSPSVTNDNWLGMFPNPSTKNKNELRSDSAFTTEYVTTHSAEDAYALVL